MYVVVLLSIVNLSVDIRYPIKVSWQSRCFSCKLEITTSTWSKGKLVPSAARVGKHAGRHSSLFLHPTIHVSYLVNFVVCEIQQRRLIEVQ